MMKNQPGPALIAFASLLSFTWGPDDECPGEFICVASFVGFPGYEPAGVCGGFAAPSRESELRLAQRAAKAIAAEHGQTIPPRNCAPESFPVVVAAVRVVNEGRNV